MSYWLEKAKWASVGLFLIFIGAAAVYEAQGIYPPLFIMITALGVIIGISGGVCIIAALVYSRQDHEKYQQKKGR